MIRERRRDYSTLQFTKLEQLQIDRGDRIIISKGPSYIADIIQESNRLGILGRRVTDICVVETNESKEVEVELWTAPFERMK